MKRGVALLASIVATTEAMATTSQRGAFILFEGIYRIPVYCFVISSITKIWL
jgi:hypothetical protein